MTQTMLAIFAMMLAALFVFEQQRNVQRAQQLMLRNEVMTQAMAVATDRLDEIGAMAFDEATKGGNEVSVVSGLTSKATFVNDSPPIDDVDDFDGANVNRFRVVWADTLWYEVHSSVSYASEADPAVVMADPTVKTKFKKATVYVIDLNGFIPDTISLSQSFSCGSRCKW